VTSLLSFLISSGSMVTPCNSSCFNRVHNAAACFLFSLFDCISFRPSSRRCFSRFRRVRWRVPISNGGFRFLLLDQERSDQHDTTSLDSRLEGKCQLNGHSSADDSIHPYRKANDYSTVSTSLTVREHATNTHAVPTPRTSSSVPTSTLGQAQLRTVSDASPRRHP